MPARRLLAYFVALAASAPLRAQTDHANHPTRQSESAAKARLDELGSKLERLRSEGRFAVAVAVAEQIATIRTEQQGSDWYESRDAVSDVLTLRKVCSLQADAQDAVREMFRTERDVERLYAQGKFADALEAARRQLELRRKHLGVDHPTVVTMLTNVGLGLRAAGKYSEAELAYREALEIGRRVLGSHVEVGTALLNLSSVLGRLGDRDGAEEAARESLDLHRALFGDGHPRVAHSLFTLASVRKLKGDFASAEDLVRQSLEIRRRALGNEHSEVGQSLNELGLILTRRGDPRGAELAFRQALPIARRQFGELHPNLAMCLNNLANSLKDQGRLAEAEVLGREALAMQHRIRGDDHPDVYETSQVLAHILRLRGEDDGARELAQAALGHAIRRYGEDDPRTALALYNVALVESSSDRLMQAEEAHRQALAIRRKHFGDQHPAVGQSLSNLAAVLVTSGKHAEAAILSDEALAINRAALGDDHPRVAIGHLALAIILAEDATRYDEAESHFEAAIQRLRACDHAQRYHCATTYANFLFSQRGRAAEAIHLYSEAIEQLESLRVQVAGDAVDRAQYFSVLTRMDAFSGMARAHLKLAVGHGTGPQHHRAAALESIEQGRARALLDTLRTTGRQPDASSLSSTAGNTSLGQLLQPLRDDEMLLVYDVSPSDALLFVIRPTTTDASSIDIAIHELSWQNGNPVDADTLTSKILELATWVSHGDGSSRESVPPDQGRLARELCLALLPEPVRRILPHVRNLCVVPDGSMNLLPVEVLGAEVQGDSVLVDSAPAVVYNASISVWSDVRRRAEARRARQRETELGLVAIGDARFGSQTQLTVAESSESFLLAAAATDPPEVPELRSRTRAALGPLRQLPATRPEIQAIARLFAAAKVGLATSEPTAPEPIVLLGSDATVGNLDANAARAAVLHLATHGTASARDAHLCALAFTPPDAPTPEDDGFLRLGDLLTKWAGKLEGTELVTLSACRTATGRLEAGDGFVALTWGFLFAGAESVVASLWKVDDTATALLMVRFYECMLGKDLYSRGIGRPGPRNDDGSPKVLAKAEALHEAKRWLRSLTREDAEKARRAIGLDQIGPTEGSAPQTVSGSQAVSSGSQTPPTGGTELQPSHAAKSTGSGSETDSAPQSRPSEPHEAGSASRRPESASKTASASETPPTDGAETRGGPSLAPGAPVHVEANPDHPYADPYYWAAFILIGDGG